MSRFVAAACCTTVRSRLGERSTTVQAYQDQQSFQCYHGYGRSAIRTRPLHPLLVLDLSSQAPWHGYAALLRCVLSLRCLSLRLVSLVCVRPPSPSRRCASLVSLSHRAVRAVAPDGEEALPSWSAGGRQCGQRIGATHSDAQRGKEQNETRDERTERGVRLLLSHSIGGVLMCSWPAPLCSCSRDNRVNATLPPRRVSRASFPPSSSRDGLVAGE